MLCNILLDKCFHVSCREKWFPNIRNPPDFSEEISIFHKSRLLLDADVHQLEPISNLKLIDLLQSAKILFLRFPKNCYAKKDNHLSKVFTEKKAIITSWQRTPRTVLRCLLSFGQKNNDKHNKGSPGYPSFLLLSSGHIVWSISIFGTIFDS